MRKGAGKHLDVDGLLKQVFSDDLPVDAEARMAAQLDRFRLDWEKTRKARDVRASRLGRLSFAPARVVLVVASVCLVVLGLSLRPKKTPTALASSLVLLQKTVSVSAQVSTQRTMECTVSLDTAEKTSLRYVIRWISPEETQVRVLRDGKEVVHTFHPQRMENSVLELIARPGGKKTRDEPPLEMELLPVEDLLTPSRFLRLLEGRWRPAGIKRQDGCDQESFSIGKFPAAAPSRLTVDACTFLPVKLEQDFGPGEKLEAVFRWASQSEPGIFSRTMPS